LKSLRALTRSGSFEELHDCIDEIIRPISGVGELTVYDTALRIGARRGLYPTKVYLHAGTRIGAKNLGLAWRQPTLDMDDLPLPLQALPAYEVEDVLCIYDDFFAAEAAVASSATCGPAQSPLDKRNVHAGRGC
jgi:hypothetical protein